MGEKKKATPLACHRVLSVRYAHMEGASTAQPQYIPFFFINICLISPVNRPPCGLFSPFVRLY
jgi:hypothetical protein